MYAIVKFQKEPSDFPFILNKLHSFHPQLQFTIDSFTNVTIFIFLTSKLHRMEFQFVANLLIQDNRYTSITPWCRKTAWLRALIHTGQ